VSEGAAVTDKIEAQTNTAKDQIAKIVRVISRWICSIGSLAILAFFVLALLGKQGSVSVKDVKMSIEPAQKILSEACKQLIPEVTSARQDLEAESNSLHTLEDAAIKFEINKHDVNDHRGWDESGAPALKEQRENISKQRKLVAAAMDRLSLRLNDAEKRCEL
jgi:hypothetical protein